MSHEILTLEPKVIWKHFYSLTQVPRPSKKEDRIREFCAQFGRNLGLETIVDEVGNVIIKKPATPGMENRKGIILQGHMDMVPQKNSDKVHDFEKDPRRFINKARLCEEMEICVGASTDASNSSRSCVT